MEPKTKEYTEKDKNLYNDFLEGDSKAFEEIIRMYRNEITLFIYKTIGDYHAAEDISQEVFVYLLQHRNNYNFEYSFRAYLYLIAKSRASNYRRICKRTVFIEENPERVFRDVSSIEEDAFYMDETSPVIKAMKKLSKNYQMVLYLIDLNDFTYDEAAIILGKSIGQIKSSIHNARKRLRILLEENENKRGGKE